jgi:hypothetical protein
VCYRETMIDGRSAEKQGMHPMTCAMNRRICLMATALLTVLGPQAAWAQSASPWPKAYAVKTTFQTVKNSTGQTLVKLNDAGQVTGQVTVFAGTRLGQASTDIWFGVTIPLPWFSTARAEHIIPALWAANGSAAPLPRYSNAYDGLAYDVSANGVVVGGVATNQTENNRSTYQACVWQSGKLIDLKQGKTRSPVRPLVNSLGWVLSHNADLDQYFIWRNKVVEYLPKTAAPAAGVLDAEGLDDAGTVLFRDRTPARTPYLYKNKVLSSLPAPDGGSWQSLKLARNGALVGTVVRRDSPSSYDLDIVLVKDGVTQVLPQYDARLPSGRVSAVFGVSDQGWVPLTHFETSPPGVVEKETRWLWNGRDLKQIDSLLPAGTTFYSIIDINRKGELLAEILHGTWSTVVLSPTMP